MPIVIRKIAIALLLGLAGVLTASAGQYYDLALKAFDSGDYERCIELFEKKIPAEIKQEKKEDPYKEYDWWPYVESAFAIKDFKRAYKGINEHIKRIDQKKDWLGRPLVKLTPSDLERWSYEKKEELNYLLIIFCHRQHYDADAFCNSPFIRHISNTDSYSLIGLKIKAAEIYFDDFLTAIKYKYEGSKTLNFLRYASNFGHTDATFILAKAFEEGKIVLTNGDSLKIVQDVPQSLRYWRELAQDSSILPFYRLYPTYKCAEIYLYNDTVKDLSKAISYFDDVIEGFSGKNVYKSAAYKNRAQCYMEMGDTVSFFNKNKEAFELGYNSVAHNLGNCYKSGYGTPVDYEKAFEAYSAGMEAQNALSPVVPCQWETGMLLRDGKGCAADPERALELFKAASDAGLIFAQYTLAEEYYNRQQWSDAMTLCQTVAERDDSIPDAARASVCKKIASMYTHGRGVEPDEAAAKLWWDRAASYGDDDADLISRWLGQNQ